MILEEPVRGGTPPAWFLALPGIERMRALAQGLLPQPPISRLLGLRPAHVGPGSGTWSMPASGWLQGALGALEVTPLVEAALTGVGMTTLPTGSDLEPVSLALSTPAPSYRPRRGPRPGAAGTAPRAPCRRTSVAADERAGASCYTAPASMLPPDPPMEPSRPSRVATAPRMMILLPSVLAAISGCAGRPIRETAPRAACEPGDTGMVRDVLHFGRNRPGGGAVSDAEWQRFLDEVVTPRFPAGLTIVDARGQWKGASGLVEQERTAIVTLLHGGDDASRRAVAELTAEYKRRFRQEAVLRERSPTCTRF